jgi:two-component system phosphate regulon response regulator PhoB
MRTVLIVDDDPDIRELMEFKLTKAGFAVHTAADGEAGFAVACAIRPDVILLDWMMPKLSGLEVCSRLRAAPELTGVGVILLTAKSQEGDVQRGLAAGADDYIVKPFSPRELVSSVESVLGATRKDPPRSNYDASSSRRVRKGRAKARSVTSRVP